MRCSSALIDCRGTLRESVYRFFAEVSFSNRLTLFRVLYSLFIFLTVLASVFYTAPDGELLSSRETLRQINEVAYFIFAAELLIVMSVTPSLRSFLLSPYTYLDLIGFIPYFISLSVDNLEDHRFLEFLLYLVPSTRLLKITRTSAGWSVLVITVKRSFKPMLVPMSFLLFILTFFACAIFFVEAEFIGEYVGATEATTTGASSAEAVGGSHHRSAVEAGDGEYKIPVRSWFLMKAEAAVYGASELSVQPTFKNIPETFYFAAVVATTVGLGDFSCQTRAGRVLSVALAITGVLYVALPIAAFGSTFVEVWKDRERLLIIEKIKNRVRSYKDIKIAELQELFNFCDKDASGVIDIDEFNQLVNVEFRLDLPDYLVVRVFRAMGGSYSGTVDFRQFCEFFFPHVVLKEDLMKARVPYKRALSLGVSDDVSVKNTRPPIAMKRANTAKTVQDPSTDNVQSPRTTRVIELANPNDAVTFLLQTVARLEKDLRAVSSTCRALQQTLQQ